MPVRLSDLRKTADAAIDADGLDSAQVSTIAQASGLSYLSTLDSLPTTGLTSGDQAFVQANQRLYISNGSGWYNVSLINLTPQFDSDINSTFSIVDSQTPLIITNPASDSDNPDAIITYGGTLSDSGQYLIALTRDSSVWTFTPLSADSVHNNVTLGNIPDSAGGDFTYTFTATDGINTATKAVTITYSGLATAAYSNFGSNYGYSVGGVFPLSAQPASAKNEIVRFAFASDGNASDVGDLTIQRFRHGSGQNGTVAVVAAGQYGPSFPAQTDDIDTFPFASATVNATDTGHNFPAGHGGITQSHPISDGTSTWFHAVGSVYRYGFASNTTTAGVYAAHPGGIDYAGGPSASDTNGYLAGYMANGSFAQNNILRFPFAAADGAWTIVDVGDLNVAKAGGAGANSSTHGFSAGSDYASPHYTDTIYKWAFASDGNSADIGNISSSRGKMAGHSSTTHGYVSGGSSYHNEIEKYPFSSNANTTDVGDLVNGKYSPGGHSN